MGIFCHVMEDITFGRFDYWNDFAIVKWLIENSADSEDVILPRGPAINKCFCTAWLKCEVCGHKLTV